MNVRHVESTRRVCRRNDVPSRNTIEIRISVTSQYQQPEQKQELRVNQRNWHIPIKMPI